MPNAAGLEPKMTMLIDGLGLEVLDVTRATARQTADAYARWGKGVDAAGLNFGDCFAYAAAKTHGSRLLYVGTDFSRTDVEDAVPRVKRRNSIVFPTGADPSAQRIVPRCHQSSTA